MQGSTWLERQRGVRFFAMALLVLGLILQTLSRMLSLPTGYGIEDFLGWVRPQSISAAVELWRAYDVRWVAVAYLSIDMLLFIPAYFIFFLGAGGRLLGLVRVDLHGDRHGDSSVAPGNQLERTPAASSPPSPHPSDWLVLLPITLLAMTDVAENAIGGLRIGFGDLLAVLLSGAAGVALFIKLKDVQPTAARYIQRLTLRALALIGLVAIALIFFSSRSDACTAPTGELISQLGCGAHSMKIWLTRIVVAVVLVLVVLWFFGFCLRDAAEATRLDRARVRSAIGDIVVRSRYPLIAIFIFAALTLISDQARDVVYAIAASVGRLTENGWSTENLGLAAGALAVLAFSAVGVWGLAFSCWLWTRSVCLLRSPSAHFGMPDARSHQASRVEDKFARDWARGLGFAAPVLLTLLCGNVIEDALLARHGAGASQGGIALWVPFIVGVFALLTIFLGVAFVYKRTRDEGTTYYNCLAWNEWVKRAGLHPAEKEKDKRTESKGYWMFGRISPFALPLVALLMILLARLVDVLPPGNPFSIDYFPTMTLGIITLAVTMWLSLFGWLSLFEQHRAIPWVGLLIVIAGVFGVLGWTDNHVVWSPISGDSASPYAQLRLLAFTGLLAVWVAAVYWCVIWILAVPAATGELSGLRERSEAMKTRLLSSSQRRGGSFVKTMFVALAILAPAGSILWAADHWATERPPLAHSESPKRDALYDALAKWLVAICEANKQTPDNRNGCPGKQEDKRASMRPAGTGASVDANAGNAGRETPIPPEKPAEKAGTYPVYFVSTEGGGIRAAYWTLRLLQELDRTIPQFELRTFSISGVSGGAFGAALYRACSTVPEQSDECVSRFGSTDLLSPLMSAWMFEDVLATLLPTSWCRTPGCGFLSRAAWFEQAMEGAAPALRHGLSAPSNAAHRPYLFLNSTWVESGERAIASDIALSSSAFPGAVDQLAMLGKDLPLGTAAHNAGRFPYTNAMGSVRTAEARCRSRSGNEQPGGAPKSEVTSSTGNAEDTQRIVSCGHLADGGYFDNSGGHATIDAVRALALCLAATERDRAEMRSCVDIAPVVRQWLGSHIVPQVLMIRNSPEEILDEQGRCPADIRQPDRIHVTGVRREDHRYDPEPQEYVPMRAACSTPWKVYAAALGPLIAVINASGIGAGGRVSEARMPDAVEVVRTALKAHHSACSVQRIALVSNGVHYPLGWHLSAAAVRGMNAAAEKYTKHASCAP